jgi:hypothetical protein
VGFNAKIITVKNGNGINVPLFVCAPITTPPG